MPNGLVEDIYVRGILTLLRPSLGSTSIGVSQDNKGTIDFTAPLGSSKSKHIDVRYHFLRKRKASGDITVQYLLSQDQDADILMKLIGGEIFERHHDFLLGMG